MVTVVVRLRFKLTYSISVRHGPCLGDSEKRIQAFKTQCLRNVSASPTWSTGATTGCAAGSASSWAHRNLSWQLSKDGNSHGSGMSHATSASPKSFSVPRRVGHAAVGRGNAGWTALKSRRPSPCRSCSLRKDWASLQNRLSCPPDGQGTELNRTR